MNTLSIVASFGALVWIFQDGNLSALLGLPAARVRRDDPAGDPVLRPVRAVDGLRGLPAVADEGGLGPDRRQRRGGRPRPRAERPDRHLGRAHRRASSPARSRSPTSCSSRRSGSGWRSRSPSTRRSSGRCSCRRRCACSVAGTGGCRRRSSGSSPAACRRPRPRWRRRSDERPCHPHPARRTIVTAVLAVTLVACAGGAGGGPILANPTAAATVRSPAPTAPPVAVADPLPVVLPRDDGPHDRLTEWWYYTGHLRAADGAPLRLRVRRSSAPSAAASRRRGRRTSRSPTRPATGSSTPSASRSGAQVDRSPRGCGRRCRPGSTSSVRAPTRRDPRTSGRPAWTMAAPAAATTCSPPSRTDEAALAGAPGGLGLDLRLDGHEAAGAPRPRRLDRLRAGRRLVLLLADRDDGDRDPDPRRARR